MEKEPLMATLHEIVGRALRDELEFKAFENNDKDAWFFGVQSHNSCLTCRVHSREEQNQVLVLIQCPVKLPPDARDDGCRLLNQINWKLVVGSFEMDQSDGEIRFRIGIDTDDLELTPEAVARMVGCATMMMDKHLPQLLALLNSDAESELPFEAPAE